MVKCLAVVIGMAIFAYWILQSANDNYEFENHSEIPTNNEY